MTDDQQFIWINTNRRGNCQTCSSPIQVGERALWDKPNKRIWCSSCAIKNGFVDNNKEGKGKEQQQGGSSSSSSSSFNGGGTVVPPTVVAPAREDMVECDTCRAKVPRSSLTHVIRVSGSDVDVRICARCEWLYHAQWGLKLNGMWRPTPKNQEAEKP